MLHPQFDVPSYWMYTVCFCSTVRALCAIVIPGWHMYAFDAAWARLGAAFVAASAGSSLIVFPLEDHRSKNAPICEPIARKCVVWSRPAHARLRRTPPRHTRGIPGRTCHMQAQGDVRPDANAAAREEVGGAGAGAGGCTAGCGRTCTGAGRRGWGRVG